MHKPPPSSLPKRTFVCLEHFSGGKGDFLSFHFLWSRTEGHMFSSISWNTDSLNVLTHHWQSTFCNFFWGSGPGQRKKNYRQNLTFKPNKSKCVVCVKLWRQVCFCGHSNGKRLFNCIWDLSDKEDAVSLQRVWEKYPGLLQEVFRACSLSPANNSRDWRYHISQLYNFPGRASQ